MHTNAPWADEHAGLPLSPQARQGLCAGACASHTGDAALVGGAGGHFGVESPGPRLRQIMPLVPGSTLGPYTIRAELGHGGMGVVYTAPDPRLKRQDLEPRDLCGSEVRRGTAGQFRHEVAIAHLR